MKKEPETYIFSQYKKSLATLIARDESIPDRGSTLLAGLFFFNLPLHLLVTGTAGLD
jgi:hypothetical protein